MINYIIKAYTHHAQQTDAKSLILMIIGWLGISTFILFIIASFIAWETPSATDIRALFVMAVLFVIPIISYWIEDENI